MPSWVHNIVKVKGNSKAIVKFLDRHVNSEGYFDFNTIIPEPKYKVETSSKYILSEEEKNSDESNILESVLNTKVNKSDTETIWYSEEYLNKVVAWQFTESGAKLDSIEGTIDLNLMDNRFFANYCYEIYK